MTLEITVERDLSALAGLLNRLIRGANIHVETVSGSVVLTGTDKMRSMPRALAKLPPR